MQVSQINDHVTHAVIGGHKAINFTISDDAELMNVLSKALYTDQQLAVVRETLCNAWDAHIEAGITDKPFDISLDGVELIIRDYGPGIPLDMIGPVYGTYGGSTKKHDGKQTGGFGLGCKSPFAYTDHFEVTSWCQGTMTVYNMSKSFAEVQGKPGIIPIVSVPTTETGLQVRIKLKQMNDKVRFKQLIERIVRNGEMLVNFNGARVETLPFGLMENGFLLTNTQVLETNQSILLRYGHVIYPIEREDGYDKEFTHVMNVLEAVGNGNWRSGTEYKLIFQAPPNRISITPSRESLSMQEGTITTIKELLADFVKIAQAQLEKGSFNLLERSINNIWLNGKPSMLWEDWNKIPNISEKKSNNPIITNMDDLIVRYVSHEYPKFNGFRDRDIKLRLDALVDSGFSDSDLNKKFRDYYYDYMKPAEIDPVTKEKIKKIQPNEWFMNTVMAPILLALSKDETLKADKLFAWTRDKSQRSWQREMKAQPPKDVNGNNPLDFVPWLRKIVVLSHTRLDFAHRVNSFPAMKNWFGKTEDFLLYVVPRSTKKAEAAREFWAKQNYYVIDLTMAQAWENENAALPEPKEYPSRPRRKGIPILRSCLNGDKHIDQKLCNLDTAEMIDTPEFIMKVNYKSDNFNLTDFSIAVSKFIINKWGDVGGFVVNSNQEEKYIKMGAVAYKDFLYQKILDELETNPRIRESLSFMWSRNEIIMKRTYGSIDYGREHHFLGAVYADKDLVDYFELIQTMTPEDHLFLIMLDELKKEHREGTKKLPEKIKKLLAEFPTDQKVMDLFDMIRRSPMMQIFNPQAVELFMTSKQPNRPDGTNSEHKRKLRHMLLEAIEA